METIARLKIAKDFLKFFPGKQIFLSKFDPKNWIEVENVRKVKAMEKKPWHYSEKFDLVYPRLLSANNDELQRGIFFTVNQLNQNLDEGKKRTNRMWERSRAVWCEDDKAVDNIREDWPIEPNLIVNSSPGKYHYYWLIDESPDFWCKDSHEWTVIQHILVEAYGSDKSAKDLARVLRLPGFYHLKDPENPHLVTFELVNHVPYEWEAIKEAFDNEKHDKIISEIKKSLGKSEAPLVVNNKVINDGSEFIAKKDPILKTLYNKKLVKEYIGNGVYDILCPWVEEHTGQEDSGSRYFLAHTNFHDKPNFKCHHAHCANKTIADLTVWLYRDSDNKAELLDTIYHIPGKGFSEKIEYKQPEYPYGFMNTWPEPWPLIWKEWSKVPRELREPLLVPTILAFHGYFLNGKYLTGWRRRPNLYQLNLAESTANKDTNSKDVLRSISELFAEQGYFNTIFNSDLYNSDSGITSDTAFLKALTANGDKLFWLNTEATRVFQQLSSSGISNSNVMALSDKMIEVVDGHGITAKQKSNDKISGSINPNVQILFYAQPETIERYINEDMIDSGFLGRAIITIDDSRPAQRSGPFIKIKDKHRKFDDDLAKFYASVNINSITDKFVADLDEDQYEELNRWYIKRIEPLCRDDGQLQKMITRIGISFEQLYTIVLGICREWDEFNSKDLRESIDFKALLPLVEFWAHNKYYVVKEFIANQPDALSVAIENIMKEIIDGKIKISPRYNKFVDDGLVPRSIVINKLRNKKKVIISLPPVIRANITARANLTVESMIKNGMLIEESYPTGGLLGRQTKFIGFVENYWSDENPSESE